MNRGEVKLEDSRLAYGVERSMKGRKKSQLQIISGFGDIMKNVILALVIKIYLPICHSCLKIFSGVLKSSLGFVFLLMYQEFSKLYNSRGKVCHFSKRIRIPVPITELLPCPKEPPPILSKHSFSHQLPPVFTQRFGVRVFCFVSFCFISLEPFCHCDFSSDSQVVHILSTSAPCSFPLPMLTLLPSPAMSTVSLLFAGTWKSSSAHCLGLGSYVPPSPSYQTRVL